jgi:ribosome-binding factor A
MKSRTSRLNSLLKEVISEVIHRDIHHEPHINQFITITRVEITSDLSFAKVFVSILGSDIDKLKALGQLNHLSAMIAVLSSKKVTMRYFPSLTFEIDHGLEKQLKIESMLSKLSKEREERELLHDEDNA